MPLITTHNYFANEVYKKCNKEITNKFKNKKRIYELFSQGFDPFYFYDFFKLKKENLLDFCHNNYTDTFFLNFIDLIKQENLENNPSILAALYGHLAHYILDSTCHPFIIYKTGEYDKKKPETIKYNGKHTKMEMQIDAYFYEKEKKQPFKYFKIHKDLISKGKWDTNLLNSLNKIYEKTFNIKKGGNKYQKGCRNMYYTYKFLIEDKKGIKTKLYKIYDKLTPKKIGVYENYSSHIKSIDHSIFNLEHNTWYNPWNKNKKSKESFFDLYKKALTTCITLFENTDKYISNKITIEEYKKILKDNSYTSGFSWKEKGKIKYLEF